MLPHYNEMLREDDVTLFLHGACHVFALALHERFDYPIIILRKLTVTHQKNAAHVYCRCGEGDSVDVVGIASEQVALSELDWNGPDYQPEVVSPDEIKPYYTTVPGGGLYADAEFLRQARARAQTRIGRYEDYYIGKIRTAIPDARRI